MTPLGVFKIRGHPDSAHRISHVSALPETRGHPVSPRAARQRRLLLGWLGFQGEAGREGLWVGLWLLPIQLSSRSLVPSPQIGELGWTCAKSPPFLQGEACKGSPGTPMSWASHFLYDSSRPRSLSCSFIHEPLFPLLCFLSHLSGSPFLLSSQTLPHPCPHGPFKSCFNLSPSPSHLCFSHHWHLRLAR